MSLTRNKDLEQKHRQEENSDFEIEKKKQEHFLRVGLTIFLTLSVPVFLAIEFAIIVGLYLRNGVFPIEITGFIGAVNTLLVCAMRRILNYYYFR
jgi:hypothetical protein